MQATVIVAIILFGIGYVFFQHVIAAFIISSAAIFYPKMKIKDWEDKYKFDLALQFKQVLIVINSYVSAGKSVETAFQDSFKEIKMLFPDENTPIVKELQLINRKLRNGQPLEIALKDFSEKTKQEDIQDFTEVFNACKRTGGNISEVIRKTSQVIGEKVDIQQEISVLIAQKKFESQVLTAAPLAFIAFLKLSSPEYVAPLYVGGGRVIMFISLVVLVGCYYMTQKMMNIKV